MIIVIDDERTHPNPEAIHFRNSRSAIEFLETSPVLFELWLDHDLSMLDGEHDTIMPVVSLLEERCFNGDPLIIGKIVVHTANPVGAEQIMRSRLLNENYKMCRGQITEGSCGII